MSYIEDLFSLNGKVALVTGAARGNGRAMAEALCRAGAQVVMTDLLEVELTKTVGDFTSENLAAIAFTGDLTDVSIREKLVAFVEEKFGNLDVLVNNAGVSMSADLLEYPAENWEKTYRVNLHAPFELSRLFGKTMVRARRGSIINITSLNAELAFPDNPAYIAFKGALRQLTKSLAYDLGKYSIRANNIGPGYFHTDMTKGSYADPVKNKQRSDRTVLGRWGEPRDLAGIVVFLASDASSYITGQDIYVDGGWMIKGL